MIFEATREAGLARLDTFAAKAGRAYQEGRNFDLTPGGSTAVSQLSPWVRHRLITEWGVINAVLAHHSPKETIVFLQEIFWRGYFKGYLEQRPSIWQCYQKGLYQAHDNTPAGYTDAIAGNTGIACFDHWCVELRKTGYLHNHARMWFASIWIFTLRLPWELGAAFFLDHLLDGDPASNTLSWRWVAGLHTKGKHYLATADNIARFTNGRFFPEGQLDEAAQPIHEDQLHPIIPFKALLTQPPKHALRIITEEDCFYPLEADTKQPVLLGVASPQSSAFAQAAVQNTVAAYGGQTYVGHDWSRVIGTVALEHDVRDAITTYMPVGYVADGMKAARANLEKAGVQLHLMCRPYDAMVWPHATKGFFNLKKRIPQFLEALHP